MSTETGGDVGHDLLPAEEAIGVVQGEGQQARIGTIGRRRRRVDTRRGQGVHVLRVAQTAKPMSAERNQGSAVAEVVAHEPRGHVREEDLPRLGQIANAGGDVEGHPDVVATTAVGLAGVDADAHRE